MAVPKEFVGMVEELRLQGKSIGEICKILPKYDSLGQQKQVSRAWVYQTCKKISKPKPTQPDTIISEVVHPEVKIEEKQASEGI